MGFWKQLAALPNAHSGLAACFHDGKVYAFPDELGPSSVYAYDPDSNTWSVGAARPATGIAYAFSTADDGIHLIYPVSGAHYAYDPDTDTWNTRTAAPAVPRSNAYHFTADGLLYVAGGQSTTGSTRRTEVHTYDPDADSWTTCDPIPAGVADRTPSPSAGVLGSDNKVYLGTSTPTGLISYDPATDTWEVVAAMPDTNALSVTVSRLASGVVLALPHQSWSVPGPGGTAGVLPRIDGYNPGTETWSMGAILDFPDRGFAAAVATDPAGIVYLIGGVYNDAAGFTFPNAAVWSYKQNEPPTAATLLTLTGGALVSTAVVNRARHQFNDPNVGDSQSKFDWRYRLTGDTSWTTGTAALPNPWHDIGAGELIAGDYERQVKTYDSSLEPSPWTPSGFFTAADPPAGATITYPINGQTLEQQEYVEWSTPAQDSYQVRRVADDGAGNPIEVTDPDDPDQVYFDTDEVVDTLTRRVPLEFETNDRPEHVQVRVKDGGIWQTEWTSVMGEVSYTPPPTPEVTMYADLSAGSLLVMIVNPEPEEDQPPAAYNDVYVDDGAGQERKATAVATNGSWRYWTPVSGRDYAAHLRVVAVAANGTTASST